MYYLTHLVVAVSDVDVSLSRTVY